MSSKSARPNTWNAFHYLLAVGGGLVSIAMVITSLLALFVPLRPGDPDDFVFEQNGHPIWNRELVEVPRLTPVDLEDAKEDIEKVITSMGRHYLNRDGEAVVRCFAWNRRVESIYDHGNIPPFERGRSDADAFRLRMEWQKVAKNGRLGWDESTYSNWQELPRKNEVSVDVRQFHKATGSVQYMRYWLICLENGWHIYDEKDLQLGLQTTLLSGIEQRTRNQFPEPAWVPKVDTVYDVGDAIADRRFDDAMKMLQSIEHIDFPKQYNAYRWWLKGSLAIHTRKPTEALRHLQKVMEISNDVPIVHFSLAQVYNDLRKPDETLKHLDQYAKVFGEDSLTHYQRALAYQDKGDHKSLRQQLERCLSFDRDHISAINLLRTTLPKDNKQELVKYFLKQTKPRDSYQNLSDLAFQDNDGAGLEVLAAQMLKLEPWNSLPHFHLAHAAALRKDMESAAAHYKNAFSQQPVKAQKDTYTRQMIYDFIDHGDCLKAYELAPDKSFAFEIMAADMIDSGKDDELLRVLGLHEKRLPQDVLIPFYRGELFHHQQKYAEAHKEFGKIDIKKLPTLHQDTLLRLHAYSLHKLGKTIQAYHDLKPSNKVFAYLAQIIDQEHDEKTLQALIAAHEKNSPDDSQLAFWQAELAWADGHYARAQLILHQHRIALERIGNIKYRARQRLMLSMVFAGNWDDLLAEFRRYKREGLQEYSIEIKGVLDYLERKNATEEIQQFVNNIEKVAEDEPQLLMLLSHHAIRQQDIPRAIALFHDAWNKEQGDFQKKEHQRVFVTDMFHAKQLIEAYKHAQDKKHAFKCTLAEMRLSKKWHDLSELRELHRLNDPRDFWLKVADGDSLFLSGKYDEAARVFQECLSSLPTPADKYSVRSRWLECCVELNQAVKTYQSLEKVASSFDALAIHCNSPKHVGQLRELMAVHQKAFPKDPLLTDWQFEVSWLEQDYETIIKRGQEMQANSATPLNWKLADRYFRSLIRRGQLADAEKFINRQRSWQQVPELFHALLHAKRGDVEATRTSLRHCIENLNFRVESFYRDEDLGPLLRSADFAALRKEYPLPK